MGSDKVWKYELGGSRARYTDEQLLENVRAFVKRRGGRSHGVRDFAAWKGRRFSQNTIIRRFGEWRVALGLVGVEGVRGREYEAEELVADLERVWRELGRAPGETELPRRGKFSMNAYKRRWGSLRAVCELLARHHAGELTRSEVLAGGTEGRARKTVPMQTRWAVLKRDRYRCTACGVTPALRADVELNLDHIVPVSRGGGNEVENLRTLCRECNVGRGDEADGGADEIGAAGSVGAAAVGMAAGVAAAMGTGAPGSAGTDGRDVARRVGAAIRASAARGYVIFRRDADGIRARRV